MTYLIGYLKRKRRRYLRYYVQWNRWQKQTRNYLLGRTSIDILQLNRAFENMTIEERLANFYAIFNTKDVLYTSSFGTRSVMLLHLVSRFAPKQTVHFIDTTYHFPETIAYKNQLGNKLNLTITDVLPNETQNALTREEKWWVDHPKMCCTINKIAPIKPLIEEHRVWISGLMSYQTEFRSHLRIFERQGDIIKFHPLIDITPEQFDQYLQTWHLPRHPLENEGYDSIGCTHCTSKGKGREGRWKGKQKSECGLHPNYFYRNQKHTDDSN